MLHNLALGLYGGLWRAALPFLRRHKRLGEGFAERLVPEGWPFAPEARPATSPALPLWIQAASGGEAWLTHSLLPALVRAFAAETERPAPPLHLLCTTCTRQGREVLEKLTDLPALAQGSGLVLPRYFPLDQPELMRRALRTFCPQGLILLETELWPGLLSAARESSTPVWVINGRMTEKSLAAYRLIAPLWRSLAPRTVLAVSEADARRFRALFGSACEVGVMPNIKFDRVAEGLARQRLAKAPCPASGLRAMAGCPEKALLAALTSVREEEEDLLLPLLASLQGQSLDGVPLRLAVAPRHMHRIAAWQEKLRTFGLAFHLRSAGARQGEALASPSLCLWDSFGELHALYGMADAVFVGGSLAPLGGQNFLEALEQGLCPLVGPHTEHFLWVGEDIFRRGLALRVEGPDALRKALLDALQKRRALLPLPDAPESAWQEARGKAGREVQKRFADWLKPHTGGSAQAAELVLAGLRRS